MLSYPYVTLDHNTLVLAPMYELHPLLQFIHAVADELCGRTIDFTSLYTLTTAGTPGVLDAGLASVVSATKLLLSSSVASGLTVSQVRASPLLLNCRHDEIHLSFSCVVIFAKHYPWQTSHTAFLSSCRSPLACSGPLIPFFLFCLGGRGSSGGWPTRAHRRQRAVCVRMPAAGDPSR